MWPEDRPEKEHRSDRRNYRNCASRPRPKPRPAQASLRSGWSAPYGFFLPVAVSLDVGLVPARADVVPGPAVVLGPVVEGHAAAFVPAQLEPPPLPAQLGQVQLDGDRAG